MSSEKYVADVEKMAEEGDPAAQRAIRHRERYPTEEERATLRRVPAALPKVAYLICAVEFAERASYYGVSNLISNFVNRPLPAGGDGAGAPPRGTQQTAGALGLGLAKASATQQSYSMLVYCLPILFGWIADKYTGRFWMVSWGVVIAGVAHVLMLGGGAPALLQSGTAVVPYYLSVYILAIGSAMFKPVISPMLLDQIKVRDPEVHELDTGEKVIVDPEATAERVMLWFYLLINVGAFTQVATSYTAKYVGWWLSFLIPLFLYAPLPPLLWFLHKRLVHPPPGGSDFGDTIRVLGVCLRRGGITAFGRRGFWEHAKPSVIATTNNPIKVTWTDSFVEDVRRSFQATGIFCFFPIQYINDNGLGAAASGLSTMLTTNGVPNDVIQNFNTLSIIIVNPILNYGLYPVLRKNKVKFGPIARITVGLTMSSAAGVGYGVLNHFAYAQSPCGDQGSSNCAIGTGVAPISIWWMAIPYGLGGISELFCNVPAYGIAYSRAPKNMRSLVSALFLFSKGFAYIIGLAATAVIRDPYLTWDLLGPGIIGFVASAIFFFTFRRLDQEEYELSKDDEYEVALQQKAAEQHIPPKDRTPEVVTAAVGENSDAASDEILEERIVKSI